MSDIQTYEGFPKPSANRVKALMRQSRTSLSHAIIATYRRNGHEWVVGGPATWSKDELVNHCAAHWISVPNVPEE